MMELVLIRDTSQGVNRLMAQPGDVWPDYPAALGVLRPKASAEHQSVHEDYVADLTTAYGIAALWWEDTINAQVGRGLDREAAVREAFNARWAGPAAHPKVVWIVRLYWLACDKLNTDFVPDRPVHPASFLLQWLVDDGRDDLVRLIACMPYWPVGLDAEGNWC